MGRVVGLVKAEQLGPGISKREKIIRTRRAAAGLPVLLCPCCGSRAAHWVPASLARPGYFECMHVARPTRGGRG